MDFNKPSFENEKRQEKKEVKSPAEILKGLGFEESEEMKVLAEQISDKMKAGEDFVPDYTKYQDLAQPLISTAEGQVALILKNAMICKNGGDMETYKEFLQDAKQYAAGLGLADLLNEIKKL